MSDSVPALRILGSKICPWLRPALRQLDAAAATKRLGHAWLIAGPPGVGKVNLALLFANRLLGRTAPTDPPELVPGEAVTAMRERHAPTDHHPDLHWLFPEEEKRSISVEQIRAAAESLNLKSHRGGAKVVLIEPADGMTTAAANALLKTLEEPSDDTYLLLVSHQPGRLPATIRSRCQRLNVARPAPDELARWLGLRAADIAGTWLLTGGSPLQIAALAQQNEDNKIKGLIDELTLVYEDKIEVQAVAESWSKGDPELALTWLTRELHQQLRRRLAPGVSTPVTDPEQRTLHNLIDEMKLKRVFEQYDKADRLLSQLGSGINLELALQAMLLGFQGNRGP